MEAYIGLILSVLLNIILVVLIGRYRVQENEKVSSLLSSKGFKLVAQEDLAKL